MAPACRVEARAGGSCYALANQTQEATRRQAGARLSVQDVGPTGMHERPQTTRTPILIVFGFSVALLMAPISALLSVSVRVPETETDADVLTVAAGLALGAMLLVGLLWRRLPRFIRVLGGLVMVMAGFSLTMFGDRFIW